MHSIALHAFGGHSWMGGERYLESAVTALQERFGSDLFLWLVTTGAELPSLVKNRIVPEERVIRLTPPRLWTPRWALDTAIRRLSGHDRAVEKAMRRRAVDAEFGPCLDRKYSSVPTLAWLPDFQHIHLPEMFSDQERQRRDLSFLRCAERASRVILPSRAARSDFERFAPVWSYKARVLHPIAAVPESTYHADPRIVVRRYALPDKFIYLPNQFWKHKNHETVFRALAQLKRRNLSVVVVCTGYPDDNRHPGYFVELWRNVSEWGIRDQVIYLGVIPYTDVLCLMRQSICVVNPSLFEGWGITVDEARSVGKLVMVSDIPAHREQNPPGALFFNPSDADALADLLSAVWRDGLPGPEAAREAEARDTLPERRRRYAETFINVVGEVAGVPGA